MLQRYGRQPFAVGNETVCGIALYGYLECYRVGNATVMSSSTPFRARLGTAHLGLTMAIFVGSNASVAACISFSISNGAMN